MKRRDFIPLAGVAALAGYASWKGRQGDRIPNGPPGKSAVAIVGCRSYSDDIEARLLEGIRACGLDPKGLNVLLKPNLVEFSSSTVINTHASVLAAAYAVFRRLGARSVRIGEGPGHRRDTLDLASDAGYRSAIHGFDTLFTDLNRDDVRPRKGFAGEPEMYFPVTALDADLIVSVAKMKTHHWAGVTLSMKNLFGLVPGSVYGWPKNKLHYIGIDESVAALAKTFRNTFAIVDGVYGMEGNGPIQGTPKASRVLVLGRDPVAVDATCCRVMGVDPRKIEYLKMAADLGHISPDRIEQRGEKVEAVRSDFRLVPDFAHLRLTELGTS